MINYKIFLFILFIAFSTVKAQKAKIVVEYDYKFMTLSFRAFLLANDKESYFFFAKDNTKNYKELADDNYKGINSYYSMNFQFDFQQSFQKALYLGSSNGFKSKLTKDEFDLDWKISSEKKKILDYNCTFATATFRGNTFKVWFTTEINSTIFPWKLKGLPGVILEFEDESGLFRGEALSVSINREVDFPPKTIAYFEEHKNDAMPYKDFIIIENKLLKDNMSEKVANLPKGIAYKLPELRQMQIEKSFEWETQPAKP